MELKFDKILNIIDRHYLAFTIKSFFDKFKNLGEKNL